MNIHVRFQHGGQFELDGDRLVYRKGSVYTKEDVDPDKLSKLDLEDYLTEEDVGNIKELWYLEAGKTISNGLKQLVIDNDILDMLNSIGRDRTAHVYVVNENDISPSILRSSSYLAPSVGDQSKNGTAAKISSQPFQAQAFESQSSNGILLAQAQAPIIQWNAPSMGDQSLPYSDESNDEGVMLASDSSSDDDWIFEDSEDEDDDIFDKFVDHTIPDDVTRIVVQGDDGIFAKEIQCGDDDDCLRSGSNSDEREKIRYPEFNPHVDFKKPIFLKPGMIFGSNEIFRKALCQFSIENGGDYYFLHNDKFKVSAYCKYKCDCNMSHSRKKCVCKKILCGFKACARRMGQDGSFQLKSFNPEHSCSWKDENKRVTSVWLAEKYVQHYRDDPHWRLKGFINSVRRDYGVKISYHQARRARQRAYTMTQGDETEQYNKVWDYAATIIHWNPGSSAFVKVDLIHPERPMFQRLYICLDACKKGFLEGCRPILGLDGCHLKGAFTGQVLVAVGKDGNDNIFPVAYAVVEAERKETWVWFLENMMQDLGNACITFMSDRQKGLIEALHEVVPMANTRVCVRHLYNNFKVKWPGKAYKDALWEAARATTNYDFDEAMKFIKSLDEGAFSYLLDADPKTWSRHAFNQNCKSDMLLNNVCESFNSYILEARDKPILTMCEMIRRKLMERFMSKREGMNTYLSHITPKAIKRIEAANKLGCFGQCTAHQAKATRFEVDHMDRRYVVDLNLRSCGCYKWDLTGIPCLHALTCIKMKRLKLEDYVDDYYSKEIYLKAYNQIVQPMPGQSEWLQTSMTPPTPPAFVIQPGRPKNSRRREQGEKEPPKKTRVRIGKNKCSHCGLEGHTKRKCKNPPKPLNVPKPRYTAGRPTNSNTQRVISKSKKQLKRQGESEGLFNMSASSTEVGGHSGGVGEGSSTSNQIFSIAPPKRSMIASRTELATVIRRSSKLEAILKP